MTRHGEACLISYLGEYTLKIFLTLSPTAACNKLRLFAWFKCPPKRGAFHLKLVWAENKETGLKTMMEWYKLSVIDSFRWSPPVKTLLASGLLKWSHVCFWSLITGQIVSFEQIKPGWSKWGSSFFHKRGPSHKTVQNSVLSFICKYFVI